MNENRVDLSPMSIGDVFDTAFDLYKQNFALFAGITAIVHVPTQVAMSAAMLSLGSSLDVDRPARTSAEAGAIFLALGVMLLLGIASLFFFVIQSGALTLSVSDRLLGRPVTIGESYRRLRGNLVKLVFTWIMIGLIVLVCSTVVFFVFAFIGSFIIGAAAIAAGASGEPGLVISILAVILVFVMPSLALIAIAISFGIFATQTVVIEGAAYGGAINRNWALLRGRFWPPFWFAVALTVLIIALQLTLVTSIEFILTLTLYSWHPLSHIAHQVVRQATATVISLFLQPFITIALTILYFDQRMRREGFDIELALYEREGAAAGSPALTEGAA